jgi:lycopene cyclase domain-containing protein
MQHFIYLGLILFTISYPLYKSFEDKVHFVSKWKYLFPGIITSGIFFIIWDILFVKMGMWQFNHDYILGIFIGNLPLEEWLFFLVTPFSCLFIYEVMNYFVKRDVLASSVKYINLALIVILALLAIFNTERTYTVVVCSFLAIFLAFHQFVIRSTYLGRFYIAWAVCIIPFLLVNGVLTAMPVVTYSNPNILPFRIYTIPLEDMFYGMLNILQVLTIYEWLRSRDVPSKQTI